MCLYGKKIGTCSRVIFISRVQFLVDNLHVRACADHSFWGGRGGGAKEKECPDFWALLGVSSSCFIACTTVLSVSVEMSTGIIMVSHGQIAILLFQGCMAWCNSWVSLQVKIPEVAMGHALLLSMWWSWTFLQGGLVLLLRFDSVCSRCSCYTLSSYNCRRTDISSVNFSNVEQEIWPNYWIFFISCSKLKTPLV